MERLNAEIVPALLNWYDYNARILPWREDKNPYRIWISEIMLQQTRVEAVKPYYDRFMNAVPTIADLAQMDDQVLMKLWEGLGYYNRARNLKKAAIQIVQQFDGEMPADYELLLSLPGIGEYTAGAIGSIAFDLPVTAVDGNVLRIITRLIGSYDDILKQSTKKKIMGMIQEILPEERVGDFNQALMELGATVCLPNGAPDCENCPWDTRCQAYKKGLIAEIPVKTQKKARRIEAKTVLCIQWEDKIALQQRPESGLLAGLWEFPNEEGTLTRKQLEERLREEGFEDFTIIKMEKGKHIFSHVEWHMSAYAVKLNKMNQFAKTKKIQWATIKELQNDYAIPNAFDFIKKQLKNYRKKTLL
jgi:A/G-specific adenine glycosylase